MHPVQGREPGRDTAPSWAQGLKAAWPICAGYLAIGISFGIIARQSGFTVMQIGLMSVIVFAGSAQFIAVSMISSGASVIPVIAATFFVNLRHVLMSSTLSLHLKGTRKSLLTLFAYGMTDESFAVNFTRFSKGPWDIRSALTVNHAANLFWIASTMAGGYIGHLVPKGAFGLDYALTAMFLSLLVLQLTSRTVALTALVSGVLAVLFSLVLPGTWYVILATMIAATLGVMLQGSLPAAGRKEGQHP